MSFINSVCVIVSLILAHSVKDGTGGTQSRAATALIPPARLAHNIRRTNLRRPNRTSAGIRSDLWRAGRATDRRLIAARWSCIPYRRASIVDDAIINAATYYTVKYDIRVCMPGPITDPLCTTLEYTCRLRTFAKSYGMKCYKKLSYRRETARQLPTWREGGVRPSSPSPPPLWLYLCVWLNPKATTYVRQACRP